MDAVRARLPGHGAVIAHPGRGAATPVRQGAVGAIKTVEAAQELGFKPVGGPPDGDQSSPSACVENPSMDSSTSASTAS